MTTRAIVVAAELELVAGTDTRAPGGAVTVALCGYWEHEGRCRWPHNNRLDTSTVPVRLRTVAIVDDETAAEVADRVASGLRQDPRWTVVSCGVTDLKPAEQALAERLAGSG